MEIENFLSIGFVGASLSVLIEYIKSKYGITSSKSKALVLVLSFIFGMLYVTFNGTAIFQTVTMVLGSASTIYSLFFR